MDMIVGKSPVHPRGGFMELDRSKMSFAQWAAEFVEFDKKTWDPHHKPGLESVRHAEGHLLRSTKGLRGPVLDARQQVRVAGITFEAAVRIQRQLPVVPGGLELPVYMEALAARAIDSHRKMSAQERAGLWARYLDVYQGVNDFINEYEDLMARGEAEEANGLISLPACSTAVHEFSVYLLQIGVVAARLSASPYTTAHEAALADSPIPREYWLKAIEARYKRLEAKRQSGGASDGWGHPISYDDSLGIHTLR